MKNGKIDVSSMGKFLDCDALEFMHAKSSISVLLSIFAPASSCDRRVCIKT